MPLIALYKKEVTGFFNSWSGYLIIGLFLLLSGLVFWVFPDTAIPGQGFASMDYFFHLIPYLLLFLVPAMTMRTIAGEQSDGTMEWLLTKPVHAGTVIMAKFLASLSVVLFTLLPTLIYVYSLSMLALPEGNIDYGSIAGSYMGLMFLVAAFVAIGLLSSALTDQVIVAFLLAVFLSFIIYDGPGAMAGILTEGFRADTLRSLGMKDHFNALGRGVLDSRDAIYFLSLTGLFLYMAYWLLSDRRGANKPFWLPFLSVLTLIFALHYGSNYWSGRVDFTEDRRYSLAGISRESLTQLSDPVEVTVLLGGNLPPAFQRLKREAEDLLSDLKSHAHRRLNYRFVNPLDGDDIQQEAWSRLLSEKQMAPAQLSVRQSDGSLSQRLVYPYALISDGKNEQVVSLVQGGQAADASGISTDQTLNQSVAQLEYVLISALRKLGQPAKPLVGFTEGHGELNDVELHDAIYSLSSNNQVGRIDLESIELETLDHVDVLAILRPQTAFSEVEKFKIDYFLMKGGNLILALDQLDGSLDSIRRSPAGTQTLLARDLRLDDLLFTYGLRFQPDVLLDLNCLPVPMNVGGIELVPWPLHPLIVPRSDHPVFKNLAGIRTEYIGSLDTVEVEGVHKQIVLRSSPFVRSLPAATILSLSLVQDLPDAEALRTAQKPVAVLLEGSFPSAFRYRMNPEGIDPGVKLPERSVLPARIFAVADGDLFKNQINPGDQSPYPLGWDRYTGQHYGNKALLLNLMDYFADDPALIALRNKEVKMRPIDRIRWSSEKTKWRLINIALPLLFIVAVGAWRLHRRHRRYVARHGS